MMEFLATYWWIFLIGTAGFTALAGLLQFRNARHLLGGVKDLATAVLDDPSNTEYAADALVDTAAVTAGNISSGIKGVLVCFILAGMNGILMVIGTVIAIVEYVKN